MAADGFRDGAALDKTDDCIQSDPFGQEVSVGSPYSRAINLRLFHLIFSNFAVQNAERCSSKVNITWS